MNRWSSYRVYAYGKSIAKWLNTDLNLSQFVVDKLNRDMLVYLFWHFGQLTNHQIGEKFGLSYSAVSKRVLIFKDLLNWDSTLRVSCFPDSQETIDRGLNIAFNGLTLYLE